MYALYFAALFRIIRFAIIGNPIQYVWIEDMPNVNPIYKLLNDIYIVRAFREYKLEEDLFAKLLFLMRSRELIIKVTREPGDTYNPDFLNYKKER